MRRIFSFVAVSNEQIVVFGPVDFDAKSLVFNFLSDGIADATVALVASVVSNPGNVTRAMIDAGERLLGGTGGVLTIPVPSVNVPTGEFYIPIDSRQALGKYIAVGFTESNADTITGTIGLA